MDQKAQKIAESDRLKYRRIHLAVTAIERGAKILGIDEIGGDTPCEMPVNTGAGAVCVRSI